VAGAPAVRAVVVAGAWRQPQSLRAGAGTRVPVASGRGRRPHVRAATVVRQDANVSK
jgi:hypothetical protein